ncbi:hypothetical protein [Pseudobutyrivibrio sp.]|jgi:hypothetical protein|uniref:hypothetical protein n=1 Tax=Pseudobutyrivibrio sp. TaxID=2014367 RepID=UPI0025F8BB92|nr:hypothetical protein [Pseudobutyrivibrio sp.]
MIDDKNTSFRQMFFDMDGVIRQETYVYHRELTDEEKELYDSLVADANQMTIFDYIKE